MFLFLASTSFANSSINKQETATQKNLHQQIHATTTKTLNIDKNVGSATVKIQSNQCLYLVNRKTKFKKATFFKVHNKYFDVKATFFRRPIIRYKAYNNIVYKSV